MGPLHIPRRRRIIHAGVSNLHPPRVSLRFVAVAPQLRSPRAVPVPALTERRRGIEK